MIAPPAPRRFGRVNWLGAWTVCRRDLQRNIQEWSTSFLAPALQSLLFAVVFGFALGGADAAARVGDLDYVAFLAPGLVAYALLERAFETTAFSIVYDKLERMINDVIGAPLTPGEIVAGYALAATGTGMLAGAATFLALLPFLPGPPHSIVATLAFGAAGALMLGLIGLAGGLWAYKWDHISGVETFVVVPIVYMSGVFFPLDRLPGALHVLATYNPLYYVIDGMRWGLIGRAGTDPLGGFAVVVAADAALWALCWVLFRIGYKLKP